MKYSPLSKRLRGLVALVAICASSAFATDVPKPVEADWIVRDFRFHTGEVLPELRIHYTTLGAPTGIPVLVMHGTGQSGTIMLSPPFAGELFGPGQPLDASRYFIVMPDAIGHGKSSKPSDGLRAKFPQYNYDDLAEAQYRLVAEHLGIRHVRAVIGNSMGGMEAWLMAEQHPDFMDVLVPMASQPVAMAGRNWMLRRLITDSIRNDPAWDQGNYTKPLKSAQFATVFFGLATSGGNQALYKAAPTRAQADAIVDQRMAAPFGADANDVLYQWDASRDYDPSGALERVKATVLVINSADDERNPPELGVVEREMKRVKKGRVVIIPASDQTTGHGTTFQARFWKKEVADLLQSEP